MQCDFPVVDAGAGRYTRVPLHVEYRVNASIDMIKDWNIPKNPRKDSNLRFTAADHRRLLFQQCDLPLVDVGVGADTLDSRLYWIRT